MICNSFFLDSFLNNTAVLDDALNEIKLGKCKIIRFEMFWKTTVSGFKYTRICLNNNLFTHFHPHMLQFIPLITPFIALLFYFLSKSGKFHPAKNSHIISHKRRWKMKNRMSVAKVLYSVSAAYAVSVYIMIFKSVSILLTSVA